MGIFEASNTITTKSIAEDLGIESAEEGNCIHLDSKIGEMEKSVIPKTMLPDSTPTYQ